jgi:GT2 family glycosyltransferase
MCSAPAAEVLNVGPKQASTSLNIQDSPRFRVSVVIVSWRRPQHVRSCLEHVERLDPKPDEVLIVDASPDDLTAAVVNDFAWAKRIPFPGGAGHMTTSRNVGLLCVTGDVVAFIDDDANVRESWLRGLHRAFADPTVAAVAGRTCNGQPGEELEGVTEIGRLLPNGNLTGNFAADPGSVVDVDHGIGANMAFRREALATLGGFRDDFAGTGAVREDADIFLRLRGLGYRAVFVPDAVVDHVGAPHVRGRRFDYRYGFWALRNQALLLSRNCGLGSSEFRTWLLYELRRIVTAYHPNVLRRAARIAIGFAGLGAGVVTSLVKARWTPTDPVRRDPTGEQIRAQLSAPAKTASG